MKWKLLWPVLLTFLVPLAVAWFVYPSHLPPGFGEFPPQYHAQVPGFDLTYFLLMLASVVFLTTFLIFPKKFGFKGAEIKPMPKSTKSLPWWFWAGGICCGFFWWLMWSRDAHTPFGSLIYWSFSPLWWGFIFFLDGIVYKRNNGASLFATRPKTLLITAFVSIASWAYFEFYDYFVLGNWYYPNAMQIPWSKTVLTIEFLITYSMVTPVLFQWYNLFNTFPRFVARYQNGPKWVLKGPTLIWLGLVIIALMTLMPFKMFWSVWIGPFMVITGILLHLKIWNPFTDIAQGNWAAGVLIGLASFANGFFWEFWNYGSNLGDGAPTNPNYWIYNIPYVDVLHFWSEMPFLGYWGYIPFGVLVWQAFIWAGKFCGFNAEINIEPVPNNQSPEVEVSEETALLTK